MPPPATSDWEAVKATAVALNDIQRAAEQHGVTYEAARQRASREQWPVGRRPAKMAKEAAQAAHAQLVKVSPRAVTSVTTTAEALCNTLKERQKDTKLAQSSYLLRASVKLAKVPDAELLVQAPTGVALATMASKVWPEQSQSAPGVVVNVALLTNPPE